MSLSQDAFLGGRVSAWQRTTGYRAATDAVFLAAACPAEPGQSVLELGCGVGVAALCLSARVPSLTIAGVEIQPDYAQLAERNAREAHAPVTVYQADLSELPAPLRQQSFDHVIANPPFFNGGSRSENAGRAQARHETTALADWTNTARRRLKPNGSLTVIMTTERLPDIITHLGDGFGDLTVLPLASRRGRPASRFLAKARKGSAAGFRLLSPLVLHAGDAHRRDGDDYSDQARDILRNAARISWG
ncbi:MAG: methyltransferase [Pseudomonadota bacterium]